MNTLKTILSGIAGLAFIGACSSAKELQTVERVDLDSYEGVWYDIAHLPQDYLDDCRCATAEYIQKDDHLKVINSCADEEDGEVTTATGKAFPVEGSNNSELKVQFSWPFKGDYYIIELEDDYTYALVGSPDRESLWILGRRPNPAATILKKYLNKAEELGFDTSEIVYTDQGCHVKPIQSANE